MRIPPSRPSPELVDCPPVESLRAFAVGQLPSETMDQLERHLNRCAACIQALDACDEISDVLIHSLDCFPTNEHDEPEFQSLQERLLTEPPKPFNELEPTSPFVGFATEAGGDQSGRLAGYELLELIGQGGAGAVYRARHIKLNRTVAIKVLNERYVGGVPAAIDRFQQEMRAIGQLDHPHIVRATDAGESAGRHFLVMEYIEGLDLSRLLLVVGTLRVADACELIRQAAIALDFAHAHHFVHRDVKLSNLLFTVQGTVKLLDLGLVGIRLDRAHSETPFDTAPHGTADYMAPEQWRDFEQVDARADIYSLGCALFKLLTGRPVFITARHDFAAKRAAHLHTKAPPLRQFRPEAPLGLQKILAKMLAKAPANRYATAADVAAHLAPYAADARLPALGERIAAIPQADLPPRHGSEATTAPTPHAGITVISRRRWLEWAGITLATGVPLAWWWHARPLPSGQLQVGTWRPLTAVANPATYSTGTNGPDTAPAIVRFDDHQQTLTLDAAEETFLELGQPINGRFALRTWISCANVPSRYGWYFRHRPYRSATGPALPQQVVEVVRDEADKTQLIWSRYCFYQQADGTYRRESLALADVSVTAPSPGQPALLQISLGQTGFPSVTWRDTELSPTAWTVAYEGRIAAEVPRDELAQTYLGRLGLFAYGTGIRFAQPQLAYLA